MLVVAFGWLAVLDDRGLKIRLPEPGILLAPVAVGLALSAACIAAAFQDDVLAGSFGWRQPLGLLSAAAVAIGVLPGITAVSSGRWGMPRLDVDVGARAVHREPTGGRLPNPVDRQSQSDAGAVVDVEAGHRLRHHRRRAFDAVRDMAGPAIEGGDRGRPTSIGQIASESTLRGGRLLAPFAIRYIVVPVADGAVSTVDDPLPLPDGLVDALDDQLDFAAPLTRPLNFVVYENTAWIPTRAQFSAADADATRQAGLDSLARLELRPMVTPVAVGAGDNADADFPAQPGVVTVATGVDERWTLHVGEQSIAPAPSIRRRRPDTTSPRPGRPRCTTTRRSREAWR